jgi:hypothetical protein
MNRKPVTISTRNRLIVVGLFRESNRLTFILEQTLISGEEDIIASNNPFNIMKNSYTKSNHGIQR